MPEPVKSFTDSIAARYAQAVFEAARAEGTVEESLRELRLIRQLLEEHEELRELMNHPGIEAAQKLAVFERALGEWPALVKACVQLVVAFGRAEALPQIVEAYAALVDEAAGRMRATVRAAHPLPEAVVRRIQTGLERREGKTVECLTEVAPELIGGLQIVLDHRVIDGSVRRQLLDLREQLHTVRVY